MSKEKRPSNLEDVLIFSMFKLHNSKLLNFLDFTFVPTSYLRGVRNLEKTSIQNTGHCYGIAFVCELTRIVIYAAAYQYFRV